MTLVAPGVLIHWRKEDAVCGTEHQTGFWQVVGNSKSRGEIVLVRIHQAPRISFFAADENLRLAIDENDIRVRVSQVVKRARVFIAQSETERSG